MIKSKILILFLILFSCSFVLAIYEDCSLYGTCKPVSPIISGANYSINVNNSNFLEGFPASYFYQASNPFEFYNSTTLPLQNLSGYLNYTNNPWISQSTSQQTLYKTCYQESANISNQTGIDTANCGLDYSGNVNLSTNICTYEDCSSMIDGNWGTNSVSLTDYVYAYSNYTKPLNSIGAIITYGGRQTQVIYNNTIPLDCWNANNNLLEIRGFTKSPSNPIGNGIGCFNGTNWKTLSYINQAHFWEEAIYWNVSYNQTTYGNYYLTSNNSDMVDGLQANEFCLANGTNCQTPNLTGYVPYTGANQDLDMGSQSIKVQYLLDQASLNSIGVNDRMLYSSDGTTGVLKWGDTGGYISGGNDLHSINLNEAYLYSNSTVALDWTLRKLWNGWTTGGSLLVNEDSPYDNSVSFEVNGKGGFHDGTYSFYSGGSAYGGTATDGTRTVSLTDGATALYASDGTGVVNLNYNGYALDVQGEPSRFGTNPTGSVLGGTPNVQSYAESNADSDIIVGVESSTSVSHASSFGIGVIADAKGTGDAELGGTIGVYGGAYNSNTYTNALLAGLYYEVQNTKPTSTVYEMFGQKMYLGNYGNVVSMIGNNIDMQNIGGTVDTAIGLEIKDIPTATYGSYAIYTNLGINSFGDDILLRNDNDKLIFGTDLDASIYYDGTDFIINPKEVGTGQLKVLGSLNQTSGNATINNIYGEIYGKNDTGFYKIDLVNVDTYYYVDNLTNGSINGFTWNSYNLTAQYAGVYKATAKFGMISAGAGGDNGMKIFINSAGQNNCYDHEHTSSTQPIGFIVDCIIRLNVGDNVSIRFDDHQAPVTDLTALNGNLNLLRIGN